MAKTPTEMTRGAMEGAQQHLMEMLLRFEKGGEFPRSSYVRYLSNQYHLTKPVIAHFFLCAAHSTMTKRVKFREFLIRFGKEEELHYSIAQSDLAAMGETPAPAIAAISEWQTVFWKACLERPMYRLGATCVLENITNKGDATLERLLKGASFLNAKNTVFIQIHRHGANLPHGDQILEELENLSLSDEELADLKAGSEKAEILSRNFMAYIEHGPT